MITFIGLALGPYTIGRLSVALGNDLREAMLWGLLGTRSRHFCSGVLTTTEVHRGAQRNSRVSSVCLCVSLL